jgi:hypothetical protein
VRFSVDGVGVCEMVMCTNHPAASNPPSAPKLGTILLPVER